MVGMERVEPPRLAALGSKPSMSTIEELYIILPRLIGLFLQLALADFLGKNVLHQLFGDAYL